MVETPLCGAELAQALSQPILWPGADTAFLNSLFPLEGSLQEIEMIRVAIQQSRIPGH